MLKHGNITMRHSKTKELKMATTNQTASKVNVDSEISYRSYLYREMTRIY